MIQVIGSSFTGSELQWQIAAPDKKYSQILFYGANDQASSLRVEKIAINGTFKRWNNTGYSGASTTWKVGEYRNVNGNFSSIFVPRGFSVTLFSAQNFFGNVVAL